MKDEAAAGPPEPVCLRLRSGERLDGPLSASGHAELYSVAVHAGAAGLVEVIGAKRSQGRLHFGRRDVPSNFLDAGDRAAFAERVLDLAAEELEVFTRPATVETPDPSQDSVAGGAVVWVDVDEPEKLSRLRAFRPRPMLVVISGGSGGAHAYWRLASYVPGDRLESINRRIASEVGGDRQSTNRGRLMRVPGSLNYKGKAKWCRVAMCDLAAPVVEPEVFEQLEDPKERVAVKAPVPFGRATVLGPLEQVSPREYYLRLTGEIVPADGLISCPHADHEDRNPSCQVFEEPGRGWYCHSCGAGGNAPDLVSALAGGPTGAELKGDAFLEAKAGALRAVGELEEAEALEAVLRRHAARNGSSNGPSTARAAVAGSERRS
jgi:hypothetical protein